MRAPELIILDCDGVLIDSEAIACRTDAACLAEIGISITPEEVMDRYLGTSTPVVLADLETRYGRSLPADLADTLHRRIAAAFETELTAMTGVETVLDALTCAVCVASGSAPERLRHSLSVTGLLRRLDPYVFSASQVPRGKPAPDLFLFAARTIGVAPAACLVIEDSVSGVQAARAAGMRVYGFTGGAHCRPGHAARLRDAGASATFECMQALPDLLRATFPAQCPRNGLARQPLLGRSLTRPA